MTETRKGRALGLGLDALIPGGSHKEEGSSFKSEVITSNVEGKSLDGATQPEVIGDNSKVGFSKVEDLSSKLEVKHSKVEGSIAGDSTSEVRSNNLEGISPKVELQSQELEVKSAKGEVISSNEDTPEVISNNLGVTTSKSEVTTENLKEAKPEVMTAQSQDISYDSEVISQAILDAEKNPRVSLWSPLSTAVLRYLRKTTPEFSISEEACELLEEAIARKYPDLCKEIQARRKKA
jgi:hypothetical protein